MSAAAYIKDGQFYDVGNNVVPTVIGDVEQVNLLRAYNKFAEDPPKVEFSACIKQVEYIGEFSCACGATVTLNSTDYDITTDELEFMDDDDIAKELQNEKGVCQRCGARYQLVMNRDREFSIKPFKAR